MTQRNIWVYVPLVSLVSAVACSVSDRNLQVGSGNGGRDGDAGAQNVAEGGGAGAAGEGGSRTAPSGEAGVGGEMAAGAGGEGGASCFPSTCSAPPVVTRSFKTDVYPLFFKFACIGCHSPGNPGYQDSQARGPSQLKADFSGDADAAFAVVMATDGGDCSAPDKLERVCTNDPTNSLMTHLLLAEAPPAPEAHEATYFASTEDPYYQAIFQWIKGGAKP